MLAKTLIRTQRGADALPHLKGVARLTHTAEDKQYHRLLCMALTQVSRGAELVQAGQNAQQLFPDDATFPHSVAYGLYLQKRYALSEAAYRDLLSEQAEDALAHENLGLVLIAQNKRMEARTHWEQALRLSRDPVLQAEARQMLTRYP